jgi:hypothetical protein
MHPDNKTRQWYAPGLKVPKHCRQPQTSARYAIRGIGNMYVFYQYHLHWLAETCGICIIITTFKFPAPSETNVINTSSLYNFNIIFRWVLEILRRVTLKSCPSGKDALMKDKPALTFTLHC